MQASKEMFEKEKCTTVFDNDNFEKLKTVLLLEVWGWYRVKAPPGWLSIQLEPEWAEWTKIPVPFENVFTHYVYLKGLRHAICYLFQK